MILGPTAVGKTDAAAEFAREFGYEVISCDSRQIYRNMDIGTAKPDARLRASVPHWLIDILDPDRSYSAFEFAADARRILAERAAAGKKCLICGGTGLYFRALCQGIDPQTESDPVLRGQLMARAARQGCSVLHEELKKLDEPSAARIHPNDLQRVVRALLVAYQSGSPASELRSGQPRDAGLSFSVAVLELSRDVLYRRIEARVDRMIDQGLWEEFIELRRSGLGPASPGMQCVGYRELFDVESSLCTLPEAAELIKRNTRRYAKRQMTWFRHQVDGILIDAATGPDSVVAALARWAGRCGGG